MESKVKVFSGGGTTVIVRVGNKNIYVGAGVAQGGRPGFNDLSEQQLLAIGYREMTVKTKRQRKPKVVIQSVVPTPERLFRISELPVGHVGQSVKTGNGEFSNDGDFRVLRLSDGKAKVVKATGYIPSGEIEPVTNFVNWYRDLGPVGGVKAPAPKAASHATC